MIEFKAVPFFRYSVPGERGAEKKVVKPHGILVTVS